jgi:hypothetical protein
MTVNDILLGFSGLVCLRVLLLLVTYAYDYDDRIELGNESNVVQ